MFTAFLSLLLFQTPGHIGLEDLDLKAMTAGWGEPRKNLSVDGHPLSIGGKHFEHGVGTHAASEISVRVDGNATRFHSWVGIDDEVGERGGASFAVVVDGHRKAESGYMRGGAAAKELTVDLTGAKVVRLVVQEGRSGIDSAHADWADAVFDTADSSKRIRAILSPKEPTMDIAHVDLSRTELHGAKIVGCTPGHEFIYRIAATGKPPLTYSAEGLPDGIALTAGQNVLKGTSPAEGSYTVKLSVSGPGGTATRELKIVSGEHKLALTPPMGWNSWNVWGTSVNADKVRAAADSFLSSGLADFGYTYVNIDDAWEGGRDRDGAIKTNEKFGDMASLATYLHGYGLKLGIYSSPGPKTCAGYDGSYQHETQDALSYANWGVDYLKYDWCSFGDVPHPDGLPGFELPYKTMRAALDEAPRDIVYSLCQYGMGDVYNWGHSDVGGNLWRTTGDINDSWSSMSGIGFGQILQAPHAAPGGWNDPDMLVVGKLGWGDHPRPTKLTGNEQITHISLWSLLAAPLIIGCDLTQLDQFTKDVLMNPEILDIDQDPLGKAATRRFKDGDIEVWARPLADGSYAIGLFNRGFDHVKVQTLWARDLDGAKGRFQVRDLWRRKDLGRSASGFSAEVPGHGAVVLKVTPR